MDYKYSDNTFFIYNLDSIDCTHLKNLNDCSRIIFMDTVIDKTIDFLPKNLKHISISYFNCRFYNIPEIETFELNYESISDIEDFEFDLSWLPNSIKCIKIFSAKFNINIDNLPQYLEKLYIFPWCPFNKPIDNLPQTLKVLCLPHNFNQNLDSLPVNLEILEITTQNYAFNYEINKLPRGLKTLSLNPEFDKNLDNLPPNLEKLILSPIYSKFDMYIDNLPIYLVSLTIDGYFNKPINFLPSHLQYLYIKNSRFNQELCNLPKGLKELYLGSNTKINKKIILHENIDKFFLLGKYDGPIIYISKKIKECRLSQCNHNKVKIY